MTNNFQQTHLVYGATVTVNMNPKKNKHARRLRTAQHIKGQYIQGWFWYNGFSKQLISYADLTPQEAKDSRLIFRKQWYITPKIG